MKERRKEGVRREEEKEKKKRVKERKGERGGRVVVYNYMCVTCVGVGYEQ